MRSEVQICNIALARIGVTIGITSLTERSAEAVACALFYEEVRDKVLGAAPWPFSRKVEALQLTGTAPARWRYAYELPDYCLRVREVYPPVPDGITATEFRGWLKWNRAPFELSYGENDNIVILTDQEEATAEFSVRVTNPLLFDASFASAMAWALAAELALPLAKGVDYSRNAAAAYEKEITEALARGLNEELPHDLENYESEFIRARS